MENATAARPPRNSRARCRAIALHQPAAGVLTVRCVVDARSEDVEHLEGAELIFVRYGGPDGETEERRHSLRRISTSAVRAGEVVLEARIALAQEQRLVLTPGRWHLRVALSAGRVRLPVRAPSFGRRQWPTITLVADDGPYTASLMRSKRGLALRVTRRSPYAEVDKIDVEGAALTLDASVVPALIDGETEAELVARSRRRPDVTVEQPVRFAGGRFITVLDLTRLPSDRRETWDLYLRLNGETELRLGSHLDEIDNKRGVFTFPPYKTDRAGRQLTFQPVYTVANTVSVLVQPVDEKRDRAVPATPRRTSASRRRPLGRAARVFTGALLAVIEAAGRLRLPRASATRRKVYFVVHDAFGAGGIARTVLYLAQHLADDHDVEIISLRRTKRNPAYEIDPRVRVTPLIDEVALRATAQRGWRAWLRRVLDERASWLFHPRDPVFQRQSMWLDVKLLRKLHRMEPGVLVTTLPGLHVAAARFARPDMTTVGWEHQTYARRGPLMGRMRSHYPKLDAVSVLTPTDAEQYSETLREASPRIAVIPNALAETPTVRADLDQKIVTAAGRYAPQKGFELLIDAFARVVRAHPDWQLRIYGKGPRRKVLRRQIHDAGLHHHVLLMGRTDQLSEELARSSIFALSSRWEGFGLVIIEAMALGLPVVSFDCPHGPASIISHGVDGTLVPPNDVDALADSIIDLIEDPGRRHAYGEAALRAAADYDIDNIGRRWRELFDELRGAADPLLPQLASVDQA